jgi:hypothetical protein
MGWQLVPKKRIGRSTVFSQAFSPSGTEQHEENQSPVTATTYAADCHSVAATCKTPKRAEWNSTNFAEPL